MLEYSLGASLMFANTKPKNPILLSIYVHDFRIANTFYVLRLPFYLPQTSRASLEEVYRRHQSEADTIIDDLVACKSTIARCNGEQQPLISIFQFYQDIRGYVTDLRDCLNEKVGSHATFQVIFKGGREICGLGKLVSK